MGPFGVSGMSMGGYIAASLACASVRPIAAVPVVLPRDASPVFTKGVLAGAVAFSGALKREATNPELRKALVNAKRSIDITPSNSSHHPCSSKQSESPTKVNAQYHEATSRSEFAHSRALRLHKRHRQS
jgi:hypothetical protein